MKVLPDVSPMDLPGSQSFELYYKAKDSTKDVYS